MTKNEDQYGMIGDSERMKALLRLLERIAKTPATIMLQGESGTGKALLAEAIHRQPLGGWALRHSGLNKHSGFSDGVRSLRARGRSIHRCQATQTRLDRIGRRRDGTARRNQPAAGGAAGQTTRSPRNPSVSPTR
ncbi:MAG: hypothetical protein CME24_19825 [Gemmatimonadetes bacterium]|nr:hypothetical protein [Gemmatimonadota bacterium]